MLDVLPQIFEAAMVISFGISWPASIAKSYTARTAKGKSRFFLCLILFGYICGITWKIVADDITWVFPIWVINLLMVFTDLMLYFRNSRLDKKAEASSGERND